MSSITCNPVTLNFDLLVSGSILAERLLEYTCTKYGVDSSKLYYRLIICRATVSFVIILYSFTVDRGLPPL